MNGVAGRVNFIRPRLDHTHMSALRHLLHRLSYQLAGRFAVQRMQPSSQLEKAVASAVARALQGKLEPDESYWQDSIERLRQRMSRDDTVLQYRDFGDVRGSPPEPKPVTRTIAEVQAYSVPPHQGLALHVLVRDIRPESCLELGTCLGISAAYIASALDLNERGSLATLEGGKDLSRVASINFSRLGLGNTRFVVGSFEETLPETLLDVPPIDLAHIDGHHDGGATRAYFDRIVQHTSPRAVIILDDIRWSRDMRRAWHAISTHARVTASLDLFTFGVCVTGPPAARKEHIDENAQD